MFKLMGKKVLTILRSKNLFILTYVLTLSLLAVPLSPTDNICKQFETRSGPTEFLFFHPFLDFYNPDQRSQCPPKGTSWHVSPSKTKISLRFCTV